MISERKILQRIKTDQKKKGGYGMQVLIIENLRTTSGLLNTTTTQQIIHPRWRRIYLNK
jgi:hypothetical protein